ncbi:hypothetical protein D3C74_371960 [compost metagenome]
MYVYGTDGFVDVNFGGFHRLSISGYQVPSEGALGSIDGVLLDESGITDVKITFNQGVSQILLAFNHIGNYNLSLSLDGVKIRELRIIVYQKE